MTNILKWKRNATKFRFSASDVKINSSTQCNSHISSDKHDKSCQKNLLQPSITVEKKNSDRKCEREKIRYIRFKIGIRGICRLHVILLWKLRHPSIKQFLFVTIKGSLTECNDILQQN